MTGRAAAFVLATQRQLWAVLEGCATARHGGCCIASDGREEPKITDAALRAKGRTVPTDDICRLRGERPDARNLALPGMLLGSPEMDFGNSRKAFDVFLIRSNGTTVIHTIRSTETAKRDNRAQRRFSLEPKAAGSLRHDDDDGDTILHFDWDKRK